MYPGYRQIYVNPSDMRRPWGYGRPYGYGRPPYGYGGYGGGFGGFGPGFGPGLVGGLAAGTLLAPALYGGFGYPFFF
ncbi:spore coat protein [Peribacillus sp. FSL H8-0477]|uniref:spore coat protein n=1 Tax=Peribacillus sp. FSL H8-0477 TaxID=2921388 RepID=UPI0030FCAB96